MSRQTMLSRAARAASDVGLAGLLGGNLYGRMALHPAVAGLKDPRERGQVVTAAWRRYGTVQSVSLVAVALGRVASHADEGGGSRLSAREKRLATVRDGLLVTLGATGVATALSGVKYARESPAEGVPLADGDHAAPQATDVQRAAKQRMNALGLVTLTTEAALVGVNSMLAHESFRRPPVRRLALGRR